MSGRILSDAQFPLVMGQRRWPVAPGQDMAEAGMVADWPYAEQYLDHAADLTMPIPRFTAREVLQRWKP